MFSRIPQDDSPYYCNNINMRNFVQMSGRKLDWFKQWLSSKETRLVLLFFTKKSLFADEIQILVIFRWHFSNEYRIQIDGVFLAQGETFSLFATSLQIWLFDKTGGQNTINIRNDFASQKGKKIIFFAFTFGPEDEGTFLGKGIGLR